MIIISKMSQVAVMDFNSENLKINSKETSSQVRTRKELSLREKLEILKQYDKLPKMSQRSAALQLKISQPVLCKILKNRNFIENLMRSNENSIRKRTRGGKEREIETALKLWYTEVLKKNIPVNGQIIREKAKELAKQMGKEFAATDGWFTRWKKRENIVYNALFKRKLKTETEFYCFQKELNNHGLWVNVGVCDTFQAHEVSSDSDLIETSFQHSFVESNHKNSVKINSETKVSVMDDSENSETENENICDIFIKAEPFCDGELDLKNNAKENLPTDEEMLKAFRILDAGVKHKTSNLQLHYEYKHFIEKLLKKVV